MQINFNSSFNWQITGEGNLICVKVPLHRLELCSTAPEAVALSTELQGRANRFYHILRAERDGPDNAERLAVTLLTTWPAVPAA